VSFLGYKWIIFLQTLETKRIRIRAVNHRSSVTDVARSASAYYAWGFIYLRSHKLLTKLCSEWSCAFQRQGRHCDEYPDVRRPQACEATEAASCMFHKFRQNACLLSSMLLLWSGHRARCSNTVTTRTYDQANTIPTTGAQHSKPHTRFTLKEHDNLLPEATTFIW
jgi:hypothetical protein